MYCELYYVTRVFTLHCPVGSYLMSSRLLDQTSSAVQPSGYRARIYGQGSGADVGVAGGLMGDGRVIWRPVFMRYYR